MEDDKEVSWVERLMVKAEPMSEEDYRKEMVDDFA